MTLGWKTEQRLIEVAPSLYHKAGHRSAKWLIKNVMKFTDVVVFIWSCSVSKLNQCQRQICK